MSSYGGGVAVSVTTPLNKDPRKSGKYRSSSGTTSIRSGTDGATVTFASSSTFFTQAGYQGTETTVPANISAGAEILNLNEGGFLTAIVLPQSASTTGTITLRIERDGETFEFEFNCSTERNILVFGGKQTNPGIGSGADSFNTLLCSFNEIYPPSYSIINGMFMRFDTSCVITLISGTAIAGSSPSNKAAVFHTTDSKYGGLV